MLRRVAIPGFGCEIGCDCEMGGASGCRLTCALPEARISSGASYYAEIEYIGDCANASDYDGAFLEGSLADLVSHSDVFDASLDVTPNTTAPSVVSFDAPAGLSSCTAGPVQYRVTLTPGEAGDRRCSTASCEYYCSISIRVRSVLKGLNWLRSGKSRGARLCSQQSKSVPCSACAGGRRLDEGTEA